MNLAEDSLGESASRLWFRRALVALVLVLIVGGLAVMARALTASPAGAKRQIAKISILPDTPPPPPPPLEDPKKEQPKEEPKQQVQQEQPKPQRAPPPPANEPIKMEGAAGDGPSAFAAGPVTQDYKSGAPNTGAPAASAPATAADRANERFYINPARQLLRDEIERQLRPEAGELTATFAVWIEPDGRIRRYEVQPSGDATRDTDANSALEGVSRSLKLPPPPVLPQPMRFKLTVRSQG